MKPHYIRPHSRFCECCERFNSSDYIPERDRYECDKCQQDILNDQLAEVEHAMEESRVQQANAASR